MPEQRDNTACPRYVAVCGDEYLESDDDLDALLSLLRDLADPDSGEDVCIWRDGIHIAAVVLSSGAVHAFETIQPELVPTRKGTKKQQPKGRYRGEQHAPEGPG